MNERAESGKRGQSPFNREFEQFTAMVPQPLVLLNREKVVYLSDSARELLGLGMHDGDAQQVSPGDEDQSLPSIQPASMLFSFFFEDSRGYTHFRSKFLKKLSPKRATSIEMPIRRMDGEFFLCRFTGKRVDTLGADVCLTLEDITGMEEENALIRSSMYHVANELHFFRTVYRQLFETVNVGMVLMKPDGTIIEANNYIRERLGSGWENRKCVEMCETLWSSLEKGPCSFCRKEEVVTTGIPAHEMVTDRQGNHWIFTWAPVHDSLGRVCAVIKVLVNITPEVRLKEKVARHEELLSIIVESIPAGILIVEHGGRIAYANRAFARRVGYARSELAGKSIFQLETAANSGFVERLREAMEDGVTLHGVSYGRSNANGSETMLLCDFYPLELSEGRRMWMLLEVDRSEDVRKRHEVEERVRDLRREIHSTSRLIEEQEKLATVGRLAAGITHELNTPTTYVRGNLQVFEKYAVQLENELSKLIKTVRGDVPNEMVERLGSILDTMRNTSRSAFLGTERIMNIIRSMRGFVRKDGSGNERINLYEPVRDSLVLTYNRIKQFGHITVNGWQFTPEDSGRFIAENSVMVHGNAQRLCQLFVILVNNSIDAWNARFQQRDRNGQKLHLDIKVLARGSRAQVIFCDNAGGMPVEIETKVFEPFFTTRESGKGTGLGLNIALQIIREHGGEISLENEYGKGVCWHISLPREESHENTSVDS